jgi:hypothetical protein
MTLAAASLILALLGPLDDKDDVGSTLKKFTEAKSYSFKGEVTMTVPGRGGADAPEPTPIAFDGKFSDEVGLVVQTAQDEIVKIENKVAIRPKPVWRVMEQGGRGNRGAGGGGMAAFAGRGGGAGMFARAPKDELAGMDAKLDRVTKTDKKETVGESECSVFEAGFTSEGAKSLAGGGGRPGGGGNAEAEVTASAHFWVASDGHLAKYEISTKVTRSFNNREITTSSKKVVTLFDVDKTKVELPSGAKEAIEKN